MAFGMGKLAEELSAKFDLLYKKLDEILTELKKQSPQRVEVKK